MSCAPNRCSALDYARHPDQSASQLVPIDGTLSASHFSLIDPPMAMAMPGLRKEFGRGQWSGLSGALGEVHGQLTARPGTSFCGKVATISTHALFPGKPLIR